MTGCESSILPPVDAAAGPQLTRSPLHMVVTSPFAWPHVRRGAERLLNDLSLYLVERGHRVTVFAMAPEDATEDRGGVTYRLIKEQLVSTRRQLNSCHYFAFRLQRELAGVTPDVVLSLSHFDAYAALRARRHGRGKYKVVFHSVGIPTRAYFRAVPLDAWFMRNVVRDADCIAVLSDFARRSFERDFGRHAVVLPPPVDTRQFTDTDAAASPDAPRILFSGALDEPRKGVRALCSAFALVKRHYPRAELVLAGRASAHTRAALLALPGVSAVADAIRFLGVGRVEELPALYKSAAVTVLPAVWEAFGLVLVESLASGTPVVGARHGGIGDVIDGDAVGRLFDPEPFDLQTGNVTGLAEAILAVLREGKTPRVRAACRERAEAFSWKTLGPHYEHLLSSVVSREPEARNVR